MFKNIKRRARFDKGRFTFSQVFLRLSPSQVEVVQSSCAVVLHKKQCVKTREKVKTAISSSSSCETHLTATGRRLPYGITECYLPPDTSERAPPNPSHHHHHHHHLVNL